MTLGPTKLNSTPDETFGASRKENILPSQINVVLTIGSAIQLSSYELCFRKTSIFSIRSANPAVFPLNSDSGIP